jgi:hypothetical protein
MTRVKYSPWFKSLYKIPQILNEVFMHRESSYMIQMQFEPKDKFINEV